LRIFITGGTTGIGAALAEYYLRENHEVGICGRDLNKISPELGQFDLLKSYKVDVTDHAELGRAIAEFSGKEGLDLIIASAGISVGSKSRSIDFSRAYKVMDTNVQGVIATFDYALQEMRKKGRGHLVAIASIAGFIGLPGAGSYSASKSAVLTLCESMAIDLKHENIDVTAIAPGFIKTPLTQKNNHPMPFIMSSTKAASIIAKAITKKKTLCIFPWQMNIIINILSRLPRWLYRLIMNIAPLGYGKGEK